MFEFPESGELVPCKLAIPAGLEPATTRLEGGGLRRVNKVNSDFSGMNRRGTSSQSLNLEFRPFAQTSTAGGMNG